MKKILISGGSGLIGKSLSAFLAHEGNQVSWLSRSVKKAEYITYVWDPSRRIMDPEALQDIDVLINLAGSNIGDGLWTKQKKQDILDSRLHAIQTIHTCLKKYKIRIPQIIQASAIGYYGDRREEVLDEKSPAGTQGFLSSVCKSWEAEAECLNKFTDYYSVIRTGLYLSNGGGIWPKMTITKSFGFLVVFGKGQQYYSWIHSVDYNRTISYILKQNVSGIFNLTSEHPVRNREFMEFIKKQSGTKLLLINAPASILKIIPGEQSQLVLDSDYVLPKRLLEQGFVFQFSELDAAITDLLKPS